MIEWQHDGHYRMRLIAALHDRLAAETSPFRAQLLREDIERLRKLAALARTTPSDQEYRRAARGLGWTAQDARTHELGAQLDRLIDAVRGLIAQPAADHTEAAVHDAWVELTRIRLEKMVGCLSTPVPRPEE